MRGFFQSFQSIDTLCDDDDDDGSDDDDAKDIEDEETFGCRDAFLSLSRRRLRRLSRYRRRSSSWTFALLPSGKTKTMIFCASRRGDHRRRRRHGGGARRRRLLGKTNDEEEEEEEEDEEEEEEDATTTGETANKEVFHRGKQREEAPEGCFWTSCSRSATCPSSTSSRRRSTTTTITSANNILTVREVFECEPSFLGTLVHGRAKKPTEKLCCDEPWRRRGGSEAPSGRKMATRTRVSIDARRTQGVTRNTGRASATLGTWPETRRRMKDEDDDAASEGTMLSS